MKTRNSDADSELIWQGRLQVGDDPGVYGDAAYCGLTLELPITLTAYEAAPGAAGATEVEISADGVEDFGSASRGHTVIVWALVLEGDQANLPWSRVEVGRGALNASRTRIPIDVSGEIRYVIVQVSPDPLSQPGTYDDIVLTGVSLASRTHYADFGFRA